MKKTTIIIISILVIIIILSSIIVYSKSQVDSNQLEDKISQELIYLDQYFVTMLGEFNGLSIGDNRLQETEPKIQTNINTNLSDQRDSKTGKSNDNLQQNGKVEEKTDTVQNGILKNNGKYDAKWEKIQTEIEQTYQVWNTISIDLYTLNIDNSIILAFNDNLNKATQAIKNKNKASAMDEVTEMHAKILEYRKAYNIDERQKEILSIQHNAVTAYTNVTNDRWDEAYTKLSDAEKRFSNLLNTVTSDYTNQATMSQCYVLINELKKAVNLKDKEIFLNAIKNLDCSNHIKNTNSIEKKYSKFKPNLKNVIPQDTLDLHGLTRERALHSVKKFIFEAKRNKLKVILIIHGKGFRSENKISVLKDLVEYYIATEGKYYIKYSTEAPARLGGGGAKLIYLHSND